MVADEAHEGVDTNEENDLQPSNEKDHRSQGRGRQLYVSEVGFAVFFMQDRNAPDLFFSSMERSYFKNGWLTNFVKLNHGDCYGSE